MFRSRFFWKLYASYAVLVLVTSVAIGVLLRGQLEHSLLGTLKETLRAECVLVRPVAERALQGETGPDLQAEIDRLGEETDVRITIVDAQGNVVADSAHDPGRMDNHGDRPEIVEARSKPFGEIERFSQTMERRMVYVAQVVKTQDGVEGYVRVAIPAEYVDARLRGMQLLVVIGAAFGTFVALVLGLFVARRITAPIAQMTSAAEELRRGGYGSRVLDLPHDEIGILGDTLNRLSTEVTQRIHTISRDDAQLRAVLAGMSEGVVAVDEEDRIVITNAAACRLLGITTTQPEGMKLWEIVRVSALEALLAETRRTGGYARADVVIAHDGKETKLEVHGSPIPPPSRGVVIVLTDVTDLRRLESMRRDFVANVSHELKTPLTSIRGYVETLLEGALDDPENNVRFLEKVDDHVRRLTHLVTDLLTLGRIESDEALPLEHVELGEVVRDSLARHDASARGKDIRCNEDLDGPVRVLGDREALVQVVDNLLTNAIKYTPCGGTVTLRTRRNGEKGVLEVLDTGIGIPAKDLDRIFERFYRVDKARSRALGGTGLGLAIVKHLVQAMRGDVAVESEYGAGTRFTVELPLA